MLKRRILSKLIITTATLFTLLLLTLIPKTEVIETQQELKYVDYSLENNVIYLVDQYDYVSRTVVALEHNTVIDKKAKELLALAINLHSLAIIDEMDAASGTIQFRKEN